MAPSAPGPRYGFRIALALGDTILREEMTRVGAKVTVGHSERCTFVLPGRAWAKGRGRVVLLNRKGLHLPEGLSGRVHLKGTPHDVAELRALGKPIVLGPEDWGVLYLEDQPAVRLVIQHVKSEAPPVFTRDRSERPLLMTTGFSAVTFLLLMTIAFLRYDPDRPDLTVDDIDERFARVMFNKPPEPPPEEEPEISDEDQEEEKERKKAGGKEGKFGDPNKRGPSNVPRNPNETLSEKVNVGLVKELNQLDKNPAMADLLGVSGQLANAFGGQDEGELVVGAGNFGMSTRGAGGGGGGEGEGTIHGTGDVDVGGGGSATRKKTVKGTKKPKEKKVSVRTGTAKVKGQLSKELIDRVVRRHKKQIQFCFEKQLLRHPNLSGKVSLKWIITMSGGVTGAKVSSSSLGNKDAESCMLRSLRSWKFPKPQGGVVEVVYPFHFGAK